MTPQAAEAFVDRYLRAIEAKDLAALDAIFDDALVQVEHPNALSTRGSRNDKATLLAGVEHGATLLSREHYTAEDVVVMGDRIACRLRWTAQLAMDLYGRPAGSLLEANLAMFMTVRGGRIVDLANYDCIAPPD